MEALAVLPVFFDLQGKRVVLTGGSDAAAWKGELLAASGAHVHVFANELGCVFEELIQEGAASGWFHWHKREWEPSDLEGAGLAVCDAADMTEAARFHSAACAAGVPVNVIDKPRFCQFQFGSIVNRSPVVVGISTAGAAPILGQAIRRRIETLLPPALAAWAALAGRLRQEVTERLKEGPPRRLFWERYVDRAFGAPPGRDAGRNIIDDCARIAQARKTGRVTLVGAGPGEAELLTLKAVRALQAADVILFDDLVSDGVLELARREARRMLVGKRGGRESCRQEDINDMMVKLARAGKNVVRLKSGDPMIFGRAGEEIARLQAEGIPVTVVPGITSASAMAAALGISLTHRDHAQSVRFVTGHSRHGRLPEDMDWRAVASRRTTTVFYMGGRTAASISATLQEHGLPGKTPAVVCSSVSRPKSRRWTGTVAEIGEGMAEIGYDEPVLIGVGAVFGALAAASSVERPAVAHA